MLLLGHRRYMKKCLLHLDLVLKRSHQEILSFPFDLCINRVVCVLYQEGFFFFDAQYQMRRRKRLNEISVVSDEGSA